MTGFLRWSSCTYEALLHLYPRELREEFGSEMTMVFADDLGDAWRKDRAAGAIRVWWYTLSEFVRIALPHQLSQLEATVAVVAFAWSLAMFAAEGCLAFRYLPAALIPAEAMRHILLPSLAQATCAWAAVCLSRTDPPISLLRQGRDDA